MSRGGGWIITATGRQFWPLDPDPLDISIRDIAHHLANQCRFNGAPSKNGYPVHYSVAEHSVRVSRAVAMYGATVALWGLLHDAAEAYIGDMVRPVKKDPRLAAFEEAEERILAAVAERFGLTLPIPDVVWAADDALLHAEARDLLPKCEESWVRLDLAHPDPIEPWTADEAKLQFRNTFERLSRAVRTLEPVPA